jgi:hypothetical protein
LRGAWSIIRRWEERAVSAAFDGCFHQAGLPGKI